MARMAWPRWVDKAILWRVCALLLIYEGFYRLDLILPREGTRSAVAVPLEWFGHRVTSNDHAADVFLRVDDIVFSMTPECTYLDLFLLLSLFCWRKQSGLSVNVARMGAVAVVVFCVNLARLVFALHFHAEGRPWYQVHELPDAIIYWPSVAIAAILWLRSYWKSAGLPGKS